MQGTKEGHFFNGAQCLSLLVVFLISIEIQDFVSLGISCFVLVKKTCILATIVGILQI